MNGLDFENMILLISMCIICSLSIRISKVESEYNRIIEELVSLNNRIDTLEKSHGSLSDERAELEEHRKKINEIFEKMKGAV